MMDAVELQERAWALEEEGKLEEAFDACSEALALIEAADGPESPDGANLLNELARLERDRQRYDSALACAVKAHAIEVALGDRFTGAAAATIRAGTQSLLGDLWRMRGDYAQAATYLEQALAGTLAEFGEQSAEVADARNNLAILYKYSGSFAAARGLYEQSLRTLTAMHGPLSLPVSVILHNIGGVLHAQGDFAAAEQPGRRAWEISRQLLGDDHPGVMLDAAAYAAILDGLERYDESEPIHVRMLNFMLRTYGPDHYEVAAALHNLAAVSDSLGRPDEAERHYRRSMAIKECLLGSCSPDLALTCNNLGRLLHSTGQTGEAVTLLQRAVKIMESQLPDDHPHLLAARRNLRQTRSVGSAISCSAGGVDGDFRKPA
jgi:tetratricopeptide (TPR) repeat protein